MLGLLVLVLVLVVVGFVVHVVWLVATIFALIWIVAFALVPLRVRSGGVSSTDNRLRAQTQRRQRVRVGPARLHLFVVVGEPDRLAVQLRPRVSGIPFAGSDVEVIT
jgi:hypothetical protein